MAPIKAGPVAAVVGANVERLRIARGLSRADLADLVRPRQPSLAHNSALSRTVHGSRLVSVDDLVALAAAFDLRPEQLLTPYECPTCSGKPPAGFMCTDCGENGPTAGQREEP